MTIAAELAVLEAAYQRDRSKENQRSLRDAQVRAKRADWLRCQATVIGQTGPLSWWILEVRVRGSYGEVLYFVTIEESSVWETMTDLDFRGIEGRALRMASALYVDGVDPYRPVGVFPLNLRSAAQVQRIYTHRLVESTISGPMREYAKSLQIFGKAMGEVGRAAERDAQKVLEAMSRLGDNIRIHFQYVRREIVPPFMLELAAPVPAKPKREDRPWEDRRKFHPSRVRRQR